METNKHAIKAYRGETFTIDKVIRNLDGSPYIISNELQNPYFLLSVSNSEYAQDNRFSRNYWLSLENFPRFTLTQPLSSKDIIGWTDEEVTEFPELIIELGGEMYSITPEFAVIERNGEYLYWNGGWKNYECRLVKTFLSSDTKDWNAQRYLYSIQLAYGVKNREYLESIADSYEIEYSKTIPADDDWDAKDYLSDKQLYTKLTDLGHKFPSGYNWDMPIANVSTVSILPQTELTIINYPQGGVF